jgi:hypothetical protein
MSTPAQAPGTFCSQCVAASEAKTPGNISATNGIGRMFYGNTDPCQACGSTIRTLWFALIYLPLIPLGSYRYIEIKTTGLGSRFFSRKTATRWDQVLKTWVIGWLVGAAVVAAVIAWENFKGR